MITPCLSPLLPAPPGPAPSAHPRSSAERDAPEMQQEEPRATGDEAGAALLPRRSGDRSIATSPSDPPRNRTDCPWTRPSRGILRARRMQCRAILGGGAAPETRPQSTPTFSRPPRWEGSSRRGSQGAHERMETRGGLLARDSQGLECCDRRANDNTRITRTQCEPISPTTPSR